MLPKEMDEEEKYNQKSNKNQKPEGQHFTIIEKTRNDNITKSYRKCIRIGF
jgi:hypothetical protein